MTSISNGRFSRPVGATLLGLAAFVVTSAWIYVLFTIVPAIFGSAGGAG